MIQIIATMVATPLKHLKYPYLLAASLILLGALIKIVIPSGISVAALLIATLYPVLLEVGCTRATSAAAIMLSYTACWGPSDASLYTALSLAGIEDVSVSEWFVRYQIPINLIMLIILMVVFIIVSRFFDRREHQEPEKSAENAKKLSEIGVPYFYALLPLLPLVFVLIFSQLVVKSIVISVGAAVFLSLFISAAVHIICTKAFKESFNQLQVMYDGMGDYLKGPGILVVFGTLFAAALNGIGGMDLIVQSLYSLGGGNSVILVMAAVLVGVIIVGITGVYNGNISLIIPFMTSVIASTELNSLPLLSLAIMGCGLGSALSPIMGASLYIASATNVNVITIVKRNLIPVICAAVLTVIISMMFFI